MEQRLIDANALYKNVKQEWDNDIGFVDVLCIIDEQPTVDAVQVVRCKDCKHHEDEEMGMVYCTHIVGSWVAEDFFCADGERRSDD